MSKVTKKQEQLDATILARAKRRRVSEAEHQDRETTSSKAKKKSGLRDDLPSKDFQLDGTGSGSQELAAEKKVASNSTGTKPKLDEKITYIALLRGVNVGSHNRLPMAELRTQLSELGYESVRTHLQSGNALFTTSATSNEKLGSKIAEKLKGSLGLSVDVLVQTQHELREIATDSPFEEEGRKDGSKLLIMFLPRPIAAAERGLADGNHLPERVSFGQHEVYLWCPNGVSAAKHGMGYWEKRLGMLGTARNWNTVTKLLELAES